MSAPTRLLVVTHTHWDREWYHHAARFRQHLVALLDAALAAPPGSRPPLLLDGQAIVLEDYLAVRPDVQPALAAALADGRLASGPWYVLADLLLPRGESLIRNLQAGRRVLARLGATPPRVCYAPDAFGHPAWLPSIAAGFDLPLAIVWRGLGGARWPAADTVRWEAPDGATVVVRHLPPEGYEFGSALPTEAPLAARRAEQIIDTLGARSNTAVPLLTVGADHHAPDPHAAVAIAQLGEAMAARGWRLDAVSMHEAVDAIVAAATDVPVIRGELRESCGYVWALQGTFATRTNQKRRHARLERRLLVDVEPLVTVAWAMVGGAAAPPAADGRIGAAQLPALLDAAWRELLACHPHDTLAGCSIDAVARAMDARLDAVEAACDGLVSAARDLLLAHDRVAARAARPQWVPQLVVRNALAWPRLGLATLRVVRSWQDEAVGPGSAPQSTNDVDLPPVRALPLASTVQSVRQFRTRERLESPQHYPDNDLVVVDDVLAWLPAPVPALGVVSAAVDHPSVDQPVVAVQEPGGTPSAPRHVTATQGDEVVTLDNGLLHVVIDGAGIQVRDVDGPWRRESLLVLVDESDRGDSYTPDPFGTPRRAAFGAPEVTMAGPLRAAVRIPFRFSPATVEHGILECTLDAESPALRVDVRGRNRSDDHRVRLLVAGDAHQTASLADSGFGAIARHRLEVPEGDQHDERLIHAAPLHDWVVTAGAPSLLIISDGIPEYEPLPSGALALTLLRSTGELSRNDLATRRGHAGWPEPIPEAQQHGPFEATCWIARAAAHDVAAHAAALADTVLHPLTGTTYRDAITLRSNVQPLRLEGNGLRLLALKPSEDRRAVVARVINLTDRAQQGRLHAAMAIGAATRARLDETALEPLPVEGATVTFTAPPQTAITVRLELPEP